MFPVWHCQGNVRFKLWFTILYKKYKIWTRTCSFANNVHKFQLVFQPSHALFPVLKTSIFLTYNISMTIFNCYHLILCFCQAFSLIFRNTDPTIDDEYKHNPSIDKKCCRESNLIKKYWIQFGRWKLTDTRYWSNNTRGMWPEKIRMILILKLLSIE